MITLEKARNLSSLIAFESLFPSISILLAGSSQSQIYDLDFLNLVSGKSFAGPKKHKATAMTIAFPSISERSQAHCQHLLIAS